MGSVRRALRLPWHIPPSRCWDRDQSTSTSRGSPSSGYPFGKANTSCFLWPMPAGYQRLIATIIPPRRTGASATTATLAMAFPTG